MSTKNDSIPQAPEVLQGKGTEAEPNTEEVSNFEDYMEPRIVGGTVTNIKDYPYLVHIAIKEFHACGGSYISELWVLTAAHCIVVNENGTFTCTMGRTYLFEQDDIQVINSSYAVAHPKYDPNTDYNDVGLIMMERPFVMGVKAAKISLAREPYTNYDVKCTVAGWGVTREQDMHDRTKLSNQLRFVELPMIKQSKCKKIYYPEKFREHFVGGKVFCAGYEKGGLDACQGDSGGPFVCQKIQVGIVSWGIGCGSELPGVYTNITTYISWIDYVIESNVGKLSTKYRRNSGLSPLKIELKNVILITVIGIEILYI